VFRSCRQVAMALASFLFCASTSALWLCGHMMQNVFLINRITSFFYNRASLGAPLAIFQAEREGFNRRRQARRGGSLPGCWWVFVASRSCSFGGSNKKSINIQVRRVTGAAGANMNREIRPFLLETEFDLSIVSPPQTCNYYHNRWLISFLCYFNRNRREPLIYTHPPSSRVPWKRDPFFGSR
jgi:hypothetical protein